MFVQIIYSIAHTHSPGNKLLFIIIKPSTLIGIENVKIFSEIYSLLLMFRNEYKTCFC